MATAVQNMVDSMCQEGNPPKVGDSLIEEQRGWPIKIWLVVEVHETTIVIQNEEGYRGMVQLPMGAFDAIDRYQVQSWY